MRQDIIAGTLALATLLLAGCRPAVEQAPRKTTAVKPPPLVPLEQPPQSLARLGGGTPLSWDDLKGREVLLYFTGPWTDSGRDAADWVRKVSLKNVTIVPAIVDHRDTAAIEGDIRTPLEELQAVIADEALMKAVGGVRALPTAVLIDSAGRVVKKWQGYTAPDLLTAEVESLQSD